MPKNAVLGAIAALVTAAVVAWVMTGPGGDPAACLAAAGCDCESPRTGAVLQPANAWSSLALTIAGIWITATGRSRLDPVLGTAVSGAGAAAFAAHATLTGWGYRVDGAAVAAVAGVLAAGAWSRRTSVTTTAGLGAAASAAAAGAPASNWIAIALAALFLAGLGQRGGGRVGPGIVVAVLLGGGALLRGLGNTGGPLCNPDSLVQMHAVWHLAAAAGLAALAVFLRPSDRSDFGPDALRSVRRDTRDGKR